MDSVSRHEHHVEVDELDEFVKRVQRSGNQRIHSITSDGDRYVVKVDLVEPRMETR